MRVILMSTPAFGEPVLHVLLRGGYEVAGLVCQPDKAAGRGMRVRPPPMKQFALDAGIPVFQPAGFRGNETLRELAGLRPDLIVVAAYGLIIPAHVTSLARHGALNVHPSLLPRWRGACPVAAAIRAGDRETGATVHLVVDEMDAGDVLAQATVPLGPEDRAAEVTARLAELGASLLPGAVDGWVSGRTAPQVQDRSGATWCDRLVRADGWLDWSLPAAELARLVRAYDPWPGTHTMHEGTRLRILDATPWESWRGSLAPGRVFRTLDSLAVATGKGALILRTIQAAGRRSLTAAEFARGRRELIGATLGM